MADNDSNKQNKPNNFWMNLNEAQRDIRVLFFENQQKSKGARANDNYWSSVSDQQKKERTEFFSAQGKRREDRPARAPASNFWSNTAAGHRSESAEFFAEQAKRRAERRAVMPGSDYWANTSDDQRALNKAFFDEQAQRRADRPARTEKMPVSNYWANTSEDQRALTKKFFDEQKKRRDEKPKPTEKAKFSNFWLNTSEEQRKKSKEFFDKQKEAKPIGTGTKKFTDVSVEKRADREAFFKKQEVERNKSPAQRLVERLTPSIKGPAASQWKTTLKFKFHVAVPGIGLILGDFRRISGLGTDEWDYETYREGGDNGPEHILYNYTKSEPVVLEWAIRHPDPFLIWFLVVGTGMFIPEPIFVSLLDGALPRAMWIIPLARIVRIEAAELDAMASEVATNKVHLVHNGIIHVPMV